MIIIISLILLFILGSLALYKNPDSTWGIIGMIVIVFSAILLITGLISLITIPIEIKADVAKFQATNTTVKTAREAGVAIESAAIQHKIIECNQWLAKQQYYNATMYGLWIPDEIDNLKPIR